MSIDIEELKRLATELRDAADIDESEGKTYEWVIKRERDAADAIDSLIAEIESLRQGLWDVYAALGCDTDGDKTPTALKGSLVALVLDAAKEANRDYFEAISSKEADIERASRLTLSSAIEKLLEFGFTYETDSEPVHVLSAAHDYVGARCPEIVGEVLAQLKEQNNG